MIMAPNSQCLMNGWRLGYRFRNILVTANTRSSSMILSHRAAFWKTLPWTCTQWGTDLSQVSPHLNTVCIYCRSWFAWVNCAEEHSRFWFTWLWQRKVKKKKKILCRCLGNLSYSPPLWRSSHPSPLLFLYPTRSCELAPLLLIPI